MGTKRKRRHLAGCKETDDKCYLWGILSELPEPGPAFQSLGSIEGGMDLTTTLQEGGSKICPGTKLEWSQAARRDQVRGSASALSAGGKQGESRKTSMWASARCSAVQTLSFYRELGCGWDWQRVCYRIWACLPRMKMGREYQRSKQTHRWRRGMKIIIKK